MPRINLLPWREALRKKRQKDFITQAGLVLVAAAGIALIVHIGFQNLIDYQIQRNTYLKTTLDDLEKKIKEIETLKAKREALVARMKTIEQLQATRSLIVRLFEELARTTPEGIILTNVAIGEGATKVKINGFSDTTARVAEYLRALNKSGLFENAEIIGQGILAKDEAKASGGSKQGQSKGGFDGKFAFSIDATVSIPKTDVEDKAEPSKP